MALTVVSLAAPLIAERAAAEVEGASEETVRLVAATSVLPEGESAIVCIERQGGIAELPVQLQLGGSATPQMDFTVEQAGTLRGDLLRVVLPPGEGATELLVHAIDDVPAEADEQIAIAIVPGDGYRPDPSGAEANLAIPRNDFVVTTTADEGQGSLRQAIRNAMVLRGGPVTFAKEQSPFATPQTITLERPLPQLAGELTVDGRIPGRLWTAHGVTISGGGRRRVFDIAAGADVTLGAVTVTGGHARRGGAILNRGRLVLEDSTLIGNRADGGGGAVMNLGGELVVVNSTFVDNHAGRNGGAVANRGRRGHLTVTHATFTGNGARRGGALFNRGTLLLRNSILADSRGASDCATRGAVDPASTHNLIEHDAGCGAVVSTADPRLGRLGSYNGPTRTIPLGGGSPAVNLGDNAAALDEDGLPLRWDQRGNGDPRSVAGYPDLGAFERQAFPVLTVDTLEDSGLRGCTPSGPPDCSLRGAIELANVTEEPDVVTFDPRVFGESTVLRLARPLPEITSDLTLDAGGRVVTLRADGEFVVVSSTGKTSLALLGVEIEAPAAAKPSP